MTIQTLEPEFVECLRPTAGEVLATMQLAEPSATMARPEQPDSFQRSVATVIHDGSVQIRSAGPDRLRSRIRVTRDQGAIDIGVYFETNH